MKRIAEIITIGDEILIGQTVDTNSAWIGERMSSIGMPVKRIVSVSDQPDEITSALDDALSRASVVIITGGLGPTRDDKTKDTLCRYFGGELEFNEEVWEDIQQLFRHRNVSLNNLNRHQAMIPSVCRVLRNSEGTAPGMWFKREEKVIISLPGVPYEMISIMENRVLPALANEFALPVIIHKNIMTTGIPESKLAQILEPWENKIPDDISLAYLPSPGVIKLRLTGIGNDREQLKFRLNALAQEAIDLVPDAVYGFEGITLDAAVGNLLKSKDMTLSTAESCTGGYLAHLITRNPGSSYWYKGSIIAYANEIKEGFLDVDPVIIRDHGAVSEQVVRIMAERIRQKFKTDYGIAITGIAGPDGGTPDKPVGTVWIAVSSKKEVDTALHHFGNHRERNIIRSSMALLNMLRLKVLQDFPELGYL